MVQDSLRLDAPSAAKERQLLATMTVGHIRKTPFMPGVPEGLDWTCRIAEPPRWVLVGTFCGVPVLTVEIRETEAALTLRVIAEHRSTLQVKETR